MTFDNYTIRLLRQGDLDEYYSLIDRNRKRLEAFFSGTYARTRTFEDAEIYFGEMLQRIEAKTYLPHVIVAEDEKFIGFMDVKNIDWNLPKGELGCFIDLNFEGKGVAKKAFALFTAHLFDNYGFNKLFLRTHHSNISAKLLAESCGFEVEGTLRNDYKMANGELTDLLYYGLLKN